MSYYIERGSNVPHLPISEITANLLISQGAAQSWTGQKGCMVLKMTPEFASCVERLH